RAPPALHSFPTRRSSDLATRTTGRLEIDFFARSLPNVSDVIISGYRIECRTPGVANTDIPNLRPGIGSSDKWIRRWNRISHGARSEEHTSELQSLAYLVC